MDDDFRATVARAVSAAQAALDEVHNIMDASPLDRPETPAREHSAQPPAPAFDQNADPVGTVDSDPIGAATKAFISWAHAHPDWKSDQIEEWESKVATFTATLRASGGIDADVDLYHAADPDIDWTRYGPNRIDEDEFVLIVMSEAWADRWSGKNEPTVGAGAVGEADALHGLFTRHQKEWQRRVKIIVFPDVPDTVIPYDLARVSRFYVDPDDLDTYDGLLRSLTAQPKHIPPPLGSVPALSSADLRRTGRTPASQTRRARNEVESLQKRLSAVDHRLSRVGRGSEEATRLNSLRIAIQTLLDAQYDS